MLELDMFLFIMEQYIYKINKSLLYVDDLVKKIKIMALKKTSCFNCFKSI